MDAALEELQASVATCQALENTLRGKPSTSGRPRGRAPASKESSGASPQAVEDVLTACIEACKDSRKRFRAEVGPPDNTTDAGLSQYTRFTDKIALASYQQFLHYVPRLVNVVTVGPLYTTPAATPV